MTIIPKLCITVMSSGSRNYSERCETGGVDTENQRVAVGMELTIHGLMLTYNQWRRLLYYKKKAAIAERGIIAQRPVDERLQIGDNKYLSAQNPYWVFNLRQWYTHVASNTLRPGKAGVALRFDEFERLVNLEGEVLCVRDSVMDIVQTPPRTKQRNPKKQGSRPEQLDVPGEKRKRPLFKKRDLQQYSR